MSEPQLRAALRAREPLAPDPEAVLGGARRKIRRRRMASVAAAVVVTVGGLGVAATTLRPPAEEPRLPVAAPSSAAVSAPDLPFRFDVRGYTLVSWRLDSGGTQADYAATGSVVTITASDTDPDVAEEPNGRTVVHGVAATTGESGSGVSRVSWQVSPGKWLQVRGEGSAPEMAALAEDVVAGPVPAGGAEVVAGTGRAAAGVVGPRGGVRRGAAVPRGGGRPALRDGDGVVGAGAVGLVAAVPAVVGETVGDHRGVVARAAESHDAGSRRRRRHP